MGYESSITQIMNFSAEKLKEEFEKEANIREEIIFKKGYAEGHKDALESKESVDKDKLEDSYAEGYLNGLDDAWWLVETILEMSPSKKADLFEEVCLMNIIKKYNAFDALKLFMIDFLTDLIPKDAIKEEPKEEPKEEDPKAEFIGDILDSELSDDAKKALLDMIDKFGDNITVTKLK